MLEKTAKEYVEVINELKKSISKPLGDVDVLSTMNSNSLEMLQLSLKLIDVSNELLVGMSKSMDDLHNKLDKLAKEKTK